MPHCTVCNHPQHLEINQALLSGDFTQVALSQIYGVSTSSLSRHKNHLEIKMSRARHRLQEIREQGSVFLLNENLESVRRGIAAAEADNNYTAVFRGAHVASRLIHQLNLLEDTMQLDTLHRLLSSPAWAPAACLLPTDPRLLTDLHQALLDDALISCPDPPPEISEAADLDSADPILETKNPGHDIQLAALCQLQNLLPDLDLNLDDITFDDDPPAGQQRETSGTAAGNDREFAGNLPGNTSSNTDNILLYQEFVPNEKNPLKNSAAGPKTVPNTPSVGLQSAAPPAFREDAALSGVSAAAPEANFPSLETANRKPETIFSPETGNEKPETVSSEPQEILDETQAAELAAYLADFPPYAKDQNTARATRGKLPASPETGNEEPETVSPPPPAPRSGRPPEPPNFGNPGLFRQIKGTFC